MKSLLLQEFPPEGMPSSEQQGETLDKLLAKAWSEGHAAGVQAGTEASAIAHAEAQDLLRADLVEVLRDHQIKQQEVQVAILRDVAPLVTSVIHRLAPKLAAAGLAENAVNALSDALATRPDPAPVLHCAADSAEGLELALANWKGRYELEHDPRLTPLEAELHWDNGFDAIDMNTLLGSIDAALDQAFGTALAPETSPQKLTEDHRNVG